MKSTELAHKATKSEKLVRWCRHTVLFSSVNVRVYGLRNFHIGADREVRRLVALGSFLRKIPNQEAKERDLVKTGNARIAWYELI